MKKLCNKLLTLFLALSLVAIPVYAQDTIDNVPNDELKTYYKDDIDFLVGLDIFNENDFDEETTLTRGEIAKVFAKLSMYDTSSYSKTLTYYDVSKDYENYNAIGVCTDLGIMSGYSEWLFGPNDSISIEQVVTVLVRMLGYQIYADTNGGFPYGYLNQAQKIGLLDGIEVVDTSVGCTNYVLAGLIANMLEIEVVVKDGYSVDGSIYLKQADKYITHVLKLYIDEGIVNSVGQMTLYDGAEASQNQANIQGNIYELYDAIKVKELLGTKVKFYYEETSKSSLTGKVKYVKAHEDTKVIEFNKEDVIIDGPLDLSYDDNGKIRNIPLSQNVELVYNNRPALNFDFTKLDSLKDGKLIFISNDNDSKYDVVKIEEYTNVYVYGFDSSKAVIFDRYDSDKNITFLPRDINDSVFLTNELGESMEVELLSDETILSCLVSHDGKLLDITEYNKKAIGVVTEIKKVNGVITEMNLGDQIYKVSPSLTPYINDIKIGKTVITASLDAFGKIAGYVISDESGYNFAYLVNIRESLGITPKPMLKAYVYGNEEGKVSVLECRNKVNVDGTIYNLENEDAKQDFIDALTLEIDKPIRIKYDLKGLVSDIKTITGGGLIYVGNASHKWDTHIDPKVGFTSESVVIFVGEDEDDFSSSPITSLLRDHPYTGKGYKISDERIAADLFILDANGGGTTLDGNASAMLITDISTVLDESGSEVQKLTGFAGNSEVAYTFDNKDGITALNGSKKQEIKVGDIIRYTLNGEEITGAQLLMNVVDNVIYSNANPSSANAYDKPRIFKGYAYKKHSNFMLFTYVNPDTNTINEVTDTELRHNDSVNDFYVYDKNLPEGKRFYVGSINDLHTYKQVGASCSKVLGFTRGTLLEICVIIKD